MKRLWGGAGCLFLATALVMAAIPKITWGADVNPIKWKFDTFEPLQHPHTQMFIKFAEAVKQRTDGRLEIKVLAGGASGYRGPETLRILKQGLLEMGDMTYGAVFDYPVAFVNALPFLGTTYEEARAIEKISQEILAADLKKKFNVRRAFSFPFPAQQLFSAFPAPKLSDWRGKKIRIYSQETAGMVIQSGGTPVTMGLPDIYTSLSRGVIDGFFTGSMSIKPFKFYEVIKYANIISFSVQASNAVVNVDALAKLPPDVRAIFMEEAVKIENELWELVKKKDADWIVELPDLGMTVIEMEPEERGKLERLTMPLWDEWAQKNEPLGPVLLEKARKAIGK